MSENEKKELQPIDLFAMLHNFSRLLRRSWYLVIAAAALLGAVMGFRAYTSYAPQYRCEAVLSAEYVTDNYGYTDVQGYGSNYSSTMSISQIINTFSSIINTDAMRQQMLNELGTSSINGTIVPSSIANSNLFTLTVTSPDPQSAYDVLMAVIHCYPKVAALVIGNTQITVLEEPVVPTDPINALNWKDSAFKGALLGAVLMLAVIFLLSQTRTTVRTPTEIRRVTSLTCLGMIPTVKLKRRARGGSTNHISIQNPSLSTSYQEAVRTVRSRVIHRLDNGTPGCKTVMVTSTMPGEGKSTVAANLALSLAQAGKRVVLVDADLRVQSLHSFFDINEKGPGLAELLRAPDRDPAAVVHSLPGTTLKLISGSRKVSAPASLLHYHRLEEIFAPLKEQAQYLVIDTPPIGLLSDAAPFISLSDGVVYVIREDAVSKGQITTSLQQLADNNANILGYVFNASSQSVGQYGYGRQGYGKYGYGYGYGYGKKSNYGGYADYGSAKT
ncbi:MAG: polysaccharide biosynthesis tyrosine autokinase [bacterium]|nr:polysaccharide biosynthesis tyrosine autokinase [bacterium]